MKKLLFPLLVLLVVGCNNGLDDSINDRLDNLEDRVEKLEELCNKMNTNISSLQTLVTTLQNNDYITSITPISKNGEEIGYTITFAKSSPITIYHGEDGKDGEDGQNGINGVDGHTPIIGVRQDVDGIYYWTLDGEWLLDGNGNKIKSVGTDGSDGKDGTDGKDGITPQLKIEEGYWKISYDNGSTWVTLGEATGEDGNSIFKSVDYNSSENYVMFTLSDGTSFTIPTSSVVKTLLKNINSITYVPKYDDGKVEILKTVGEDEGVGEFDFVVSPKSAVAELENIWESVLSMKAVYSMTRSVNFVEMPILSIESDTENGIITITVSGANLNDGFYTNDVLVRSALFVSDGDNSINSDYIELTGKKVIPETPTEPEIPTEPSLTPPDNYTICYTTTDGRPIMDAEIFKSSTLIDHKFVDGVGQLIFSEEVTSIVQWEAFRFCETLKTIGLPESVTKIESATFYLCKGLTSITIPKNVKYIESRAFYFCTGLKSVTLGDSVISIGDGAFTSCSSLVSILLSNNLKSIGEEAFFGCSSLISIVIPNSVTSIGAHAFEECSGLTNATLGNGIASIGYATFNGCHSLQSVTIPQSVTSIETRAFGDCIGLVSITIPNSVTSIDHKAFGGCTGLTSITIPNSVTSIEGNPFVGCAGLSAFYGKYASSDNRYLPHADC